MHDEYDHLRESADADAALLISERRIHLARLTASRGGGGSVEDAAAPAQLPAVGVTDYPRSSSRSRPVAAPDRFWSKVDQRGLFDCWAWTGTRWQGYGSIAIKVGAQWKKAFAHRFAYELLVGPIPDGLEIDHLCRNRACVNPTHLEPVTRRENSLRSYSPPAQNARKTHCPQGHEYSPENTYRVSAGRWRKCRACSLASWHRRRATTGRRDAANPSRLPAVAGVTEPPGQDRRRGR